MRETSIIHLLCAYRVPCFHIAPAVGQEFIAIGRVEKPGRTITVCTGEVRVREGDAYKTLVLMQATMMAVSK